MIEQSSVHHAMHLATLRTIVDSSPMTILDNYKKFLKKRCSSPHITPQKALMEIFRNSIGVSDIDGDTRNRSSSATQHFEELPVEHLEFSGLDDLKDQIDNSTADSPEKPGFSSVFAFGRKRGYEQK